MTPPQDCSLKKKKKRSTKQNGNHKEKDGHKAKDIHKAKDPPQDIFLPSQEAKEARGREKKSRPEGAKNPVSPSQDSGQVPQVGKIFLHSKQAETLSAALQINQELAPQCQWMGPRKKLQHWQEITKYKILLQTIKGESKHK